MTKKSSRKTGMEKVIPAASYKLFGNITEKFKLGLFTNLGHYPIRIEWSDLNMTSYTDKGKGSKKFPIVGQKLANGSIAKISATPLLGSKVPSCAGVVYDDLQDAKRVNGLYKALKCATIQCVKSLSEAYFRCSMPFLEVRLSNKTAFRMNSFDTVNITTGDICCWKKEGFRVEVSPNKFRTEPRFKLILVNDIKSEKLDREILINAAGDMFRDQCVIGMIETSSCIHKIKGK